MLPANSVIAAGFQNILVLDHRIINQAGMASEGNQAVDQSFHSLNVSVLPGE